ncbi:MAG TPA: response regulator [Polyangiaceae bacterium]|jgi:CheY-like chemotaxis protein
MPDAPPPRPGSGTRPRTGRVLIVDDDARSAAAMVAVLADHLEVTVLADAAEAVARIAGGARFDVVLCDLTMRAMNGAEIFARVCAASARQASRIVFLGAGTMPLKLAEFLSRVPNPCLQHPIDVRVLRALVDRRVAEEIARGAPESAKSG